MPVQPIDCDFTYRHSRETVFLFSPPSSPFPFLFFFLFFSFLPWRRRMSALLSQRIRQMPIEWRRERERERERTHTRAHAHAHMHKLSVRFFGRKIHIQSKEKPVWRITSSRRRQLFFSMLDISTLTALFCHLVYHSVKMLYDARPSWGNFYFLFRLSCKFVESLLVLHERWDSYV
jgi:hypothetical protein